jgi:hypothetical protein
MRIGVLNLPVSNLFPLKTALSNYGMFKERKGIHE